MTVVEFLSSDAAKNWVATWARSPERVLLVGDNEAALRKAQEHYNAVAKDFGHRTQFCHQVIPLGNADDIFKALEDILQTHGECTFDLLGGSEWYLAAVGKLAQEYPERAGLYRYDENTVDTRIQVSLEEWVRVYGGRILFAPERPNATVRWDFNDAFAHDLYAMWDICRQNVSRWNFQVGMLERAKVFDHDDDPLCVTVRKTLSSRGETQYLDLRWLRDLQACGVVDILSERDNTVRFRFKNETIKKTFRKEGQLLELVMAASAAKCIENGKRVYHDVLTGVTLDWDGKSDPTTRNVDNEIDVLMIRGITPVFVSCKNGDVKTDELFKLHTVARHFGGDQAKTVLIAPKLDDLGDRGKSLADRAEALGIRVISNMEHMTRETCIKIVPTFSDEL